MLRIKFQLFVLNIYNLLNAQKKRRLKYSVLGPDKRKNVSVIKSYTTINIYKFKNFYHRLVLVARHRKLSVFKFIIVKIIIKV